MRILLVTSNADAFSGLNSAQLSLIAINEPREISKYINDISAIILEDFKYDVALELAGEYDVPCYLAQDNKYCPIPKQKPHLLIVEDNQEIASIYKRSLDRYFRLSLCERATDAVFDAVSKNVDVMLIDIMLGHEEYDGFYVMEKLVERGIELPIIAISANHDFENAPSMQRAREFIAKPVSTIALRERVIRSYNDFHGTPAESLKGFLQSGLQ